MSINIGRDNQYDNHFRYKREIVDVRYSGKGKNTKTGLINLAKIAKQLYTMPDYISKFFGYKFATVTGIDSKTKEWFLKGHHAHGDVEDKLEDYIDLFILCKHCINPETSLRAKKGEVRMFCYACGQLSRIEDSSDKKGSFVKYLKRHPQDDSKMYKAYTRKKQARKQVQNKSDVEFPPMPEEEKDVVWVTDTSEAAARDRIQNLSAAAQKMVESDSSYYTESDDQELVSVDLMKSLTGSLPPGPPESDSDSLNIDDI